MPIRPSATTGPGSLDLRMDKPYQLEDRIEQLFHEKSMTGRGAWNRLFDETMTDLRFDVDGEKLSLEPTLNRLQDADGEVRQQGRRGAGRDLQGQSAHLHADHQHAGQGQGNLRPLARLRGHRRFSRHLANRVEREVVDALAAAVREAYPRLSHRYYAMKAQLARHGADELLGPQRAAAGNARRRRSAGTRPRTRCCRPMAGFSPEMADIARSFFDQQLDRRAGPARQGAGRLRPSDRALGAPLRAAQLHGQAARRDDAGPRTRPRRASGAGRRPGRADGLDAADAGRNRLGLRRDADLPRAARQDHATGASARRCSPRRSRT